MTPKAQTLQHAARQHGAVTREQALAFGMSNDMVDNEIQRGLFIPRHAGVLLVAGAPASFLQDVRAATLAGGDVVLASHHTAATLHRMPGFEPRRPIEILVPYEHDYVARGITMHRTRVLTIADRTEIHGIPATSVERTIASLAEFCSFDVVDAVIDDARYRGLTTLPKLRWRLGSLLGRGRTGSAMLRELMALHAHAMGIPQTVFETDVKRLIRAAGLPDAVCQYEIRLPDGRVYYLDFAWPEQRVGLEADSFRFHGSPRQQSRDAARRNAVQALGWDLYQCTYRQLKRSPHEVTVPLRAALGLAA